MKHLRSDLHARSGQAGQSLIEVIIAIVLISAVFLTLAGALAAVSTSTAVNEKVQKMDAGLVAFGEILQTQVPYRNCAGTNDASPPYDTMSINDYFYFYADNNFVTLSNTPDPNKWRRPTNVYPEIVSVQNFNPATQTWAAGCLTPDTGIQRITYKVVACKSPAISPCDGPKDRTAQVVKRKAGPS